jgi:CheY-like chemotaxis protein
MKKVILCVDDESIVLESLRSQLENCLGSEFSYEFAESGVEGLELVEELYQEGLEIALDISDWLMPRMKGDEFLIELHKRHPQINKIILSGLAEDSAIEKLHKEVNLHEFLPKPWTIELLFESVRKALHKC